MRAVIQRVSSAKVLVNDAITGSINRGLLVLLGIGNEDDDSDISYLSDKIINLRIFEDKDAKMNLSLLDVKGELLIVSQFTLLGDVRKGKRPNFMNAAPPKIAKEIYLKFIDKCRTHGLEIQTGEFGKHMSVELTNDGPVTIILDSKKRF